MASFAWLPGVVIKPAFILIKSVLWQLCAGHGAEFGWADGIAPILGFESGEANQEADLANIEDVNVAVVHITPVVLLVRPCREFVGTYRGEGVSRERPLDSRQGQRSTSDWMMVVLFLVFGLAPVPFLD